jgi:hypothetical protein
MIGMNSLFGLIEDVARIAIAPVEIVVDMARVITKPAADVAEDISLEVKKTSRDIIGD